MRKSTNYLGFWLLAIPTIGLFYLSLWLTIAIKYRNGLDRSYLLEHLRIFSWIYVLWLIIFFSFRLFDLSILRRYTILFFNLLSAYAVGLVVAIMYFYFQPTLILTPRRFLLVDVLISFLLTLAWYLLIKTFFRLGRVEKIYLFSFNRELDDLEFEIHKHDFLGFQVLGHLNEQTLDQLALMDHFSIVLPPNLPNNPKILAKFYDLRLQGVTFYDYQDFYENLTRRIYLSQLDEIWFLENINYNEKPILRAVKRFIDIIFGILSLVVFVVTFPFIAFLVKISSQGDIFFTQERVGQFDRKFRVYKYRTMQGSVNDTWTVDKDPRITSVGKFLRRLRLDELPQFINLLQGNMSLVGPRPEQAQIVEKLKTQIPFFGERHLVKPGLTGWAQLNIYASSLEETKLKLQYDLYYIKHQSLWFDLEIILKTAYHILTGKGR